jgi:hypothetical protein
MTDEFSSYRGLGDEFSRHGTVAHGRGQYVYDDHHTNTVESYFATLKRGVNGVYHHVSQAHLPRYPAEFDFRYNARDVSDGRRTVMALEGAEGERLKYRDATE